MLMHRIDNPVDARVSSDSLVLRVHEDDLVELVGRVLAYPIRVQYTKPSASPASFLLSRERKRERDK